MRDQKGSGDKDSEIEKNGHGQAGRAEKCQWGFVWSGFGR